MSDLVSKGEEIADLLKKFYLDELDPEWVKSVINADFTEVTDIPLHFEDIHSSTNFLGLFNAVITVLRQYIDLIKPDLNSSSNSKRASLTFLSTTSICMEDYENSDTYTKFWIGMTKVLNVKSLLVFLFYYIHRGKRYDANEHNRELGIQAASLYFLLLAVPGSNAFRFFDPMLYLKSLDILKLTTKLNVAASSPRKGSHRGSRVSHRKSSEDILGEGNEEEEAELSYLNPNEANKLVRSLNILLNDFLRLTNIFSLKHSPESLDETISILVEITRCEIHNSQAVFLQRHAANSVTSLTYNAYVALQSICTPLHGNVKNIVILIMKYVMYNILMISRGSSDLSNRALGVIRDHSIIFVKYLVIQLKKDSFEGAYILVQHLCLRVPDKADFREKTAKSVVEIMKTFQLKEYSKLLKWLLKFSHNEKAGHRLFTLEVISKLLAEEERHELSETQSSVSTEAGDGTPMLEGQEKEESFVSIPTDHSFNVPINRNVLSHNFLLCIIFSRCRDSAATVRSKALALLSECTLSNNPTIVESMKKVFFSSEPFVFTTPHIPENEINCESPTEDLAKDLELPNAEMVMSMLQRRALDDKVTVRKSALQVMENLMKLQSGMIIDKYLKVFSEHCRDPALLIRKQMVHSLSSIVQVYPSNKIAIRAFVMGVFPLILDPEIKVQEKVVEMVDQLIFKRMSKYNESALTADQELPWRILDTITQLSFHKFFNKILMMWSKCDHMSPQVISVAKTHVGGRFNQETWTFLSLISQYMDIKDSLFALNYFEQNSTSTDQVGSYTLQQVLKVLGHSIKYIPPARSASLQQNLLSCITSLSVCVELISPMIDIITLVSYSFEGDGEKGQKAIEVWAAPILKSCDEHLKRVLFPVNPKTLSKEEEEEFFRCLFTLGEVSQLCPSKVNKRMFLMLQSIIFHQNHCLNTDATLRIPSTQTQSSQAPAVSFNPTRRLKTLSVITLGKMCLQHEDQAKRIIPAMGKLLDTTTLPAMKINIIIVLSDMCVRYATLVDPLMPQVTACLRDSDIQVRRTTLTLLINLLQEDYLKLKGSFFYRILQCLCDDDADMRSTVVFYMTERLLKRFPKIFLQHFIECIFHYNCYEEHESYNKFAQSCQEKDLFSLAGSPFRAQRMKLYRFMLDHMQDDQRFSTTQRLCQDVLGGVVDGRIKLTPSSLPMLEDTLMVLSSDEIKLAWLRNKPEDSDQPTDQAEQAEMAGIAIKKTIISQVVKRNVIENIVPILIALKHKLAENRSPLMKHLLLYFKEIMKDYKNEVKEILTGDKQFAKEIEFDLRKLEEEQQKEAERAQEERQKKAQEEREAQKAKSGKAPSLGKSPKLPSVHLHRLDPAEYDLRDSLPEGGKETSAEEGDEEESIPKEADQDLPPPPRASSPIFKKRNDVPKLLRQTLMKNLKASKTLAAASSGAVPEEGRGGLSESPPLTRSRRASGRRVAPEEGAEGGSAVATQPMEDCPSDPPVEEEDRPAKPAEGEGDLQEEAGLAKPSPLPDLSHHAAEGVVDLPEQPVEADLYAPPQPMEVDIANPPLIIEPPSPTEAAPSNRSPPDPRSKGVPAPPASTPPPKAVRENLMRAISTPNASMNVISNITFMNRTQEISGIGMNVSEQTAAPSVGHEEEEGAPHTLLLHFKSPEAFAKDEQFSQLRRNSKKSLVKKFEAEVVKEAVKEAVKRPSGGFMESFTERQSLEEDDSSLMVGGGSPPRGKGPVDAKGRFSNQPSPQHSAPKADKPKRARKGNQAGSKPKAKSKLRK